MIICRLCGRELVFSNTKYDGNEVRCPNGCLPFVTGQRSAKDALDKWERLEDDFRTKDFSRMILHYCGGNKKYAIAMLQNMIKTIKEF